MKRLSKRLAAALCVCGGLAATAYAAPANPQPRQMEQPDGTTVTLCLVGDEAFHCLMTPEGRVVVQQPDGFFYFVGNDGLPTTSRVSDGVPAQYDATAGFQAYKNANTNRAFLEARQAEASRPGTRADKLGNSKWDNTDGHDLREVSTEGEYRVLVIMVNFADTKFSVSEDPHAAVDNMLNQPGYTQGDASGSVLDYFQSISFGQFHPVFDVFGPVQLDKKSADYVNTDETYIKDGKPVAVYAPGRMVEEACKKLDDQINFSHYDANGDGMVDFVYIFHAGKGATTGGNSNYTIWPHAFSLESAIGAPIELDGVKINRYATSCELASKGNKLNGIGLFCHEFSHVLGLPDLYDTANNGTATKVFSPGSFSNMDAGNYNNDLHTPPMFSSYEQYALEWNKPVTITGEGKFTLLPMTVRPFGYKLDVKENPMEYYLLEARAPYGWDEYLEGFGMLVWHIDYVERHWKNNTVNNTPAHQCIDIVEADDLQSITSRDGDPFPGNMGINELLSSGAPSLISWARNPLAVELSNIVSNPDGTVEFRSVGGSKMADVALASPAPRLLSAEAGKISVAWDAVEGAKGYRVSVVDLDQYDRGYYRNYLDGWHYRDMAAETTAEIEGLAPSKNYGVIVYAYNDVNASRTPLPLELISLGSDFATSAPGLYAYSGNEGVDLSWDAVAGASHYELTVATRAAGETAESDKCNFDGVKLPDGWTANGKYEQREKYSGESAPSYTLNGTEAYLQTKKYDRDIKSISFTGRYTFTEDNSLLLDFYGIDADGHRCYVGSIDELTNKMAAHSIDFPEGYKQARIVVRSSVTGQYAYLDDIEVALTDGPVDTPVAGYAARKVEDSKLTVTGLEPNTSYVAYVKPFDGTNAGKRSKAIEFVPGKLTSGIDDVIGGSYESAAVSVDGGVLTAGGQAMTVYTADGTMLARGVESYTLSAHGIYIVRVGSRTAKILW